MWCRRWTSSETHGFHVQPKSAGPDRYEFLRQAKVTISMAEFLAESHIARPRFDAALQFLFVGKAFWCAGYDLR